MDSSCNPPTSAPPSAANSLPDMFRPPVNRAMRVLDRSFFRKTIQLSAATVFDNKNIAKTRGELAQSKDLLNVPKLMAIRVAQDEGRWARESLGDADRSYMRGDQRLKCLLLREGVRYDDVSTWSPTLQALVDAKKVGLDPYQLELDYDFWNYYDIITSILPEEDMVETPVGFTQVGHVAHLNLREQYYPYKHLIAEILKDKNPTVRTVINKVDDVGAHSEFRTFSYELLTGDPDLNVVAHEQDCEFHFDYSKVYWNSRLNTEHSRLVKKFNEGEAVCDVMAGVGPFAIPAGKKKIFVWANDLNPHGYECMEDAIRRNKVQDFVRASNMDGREFIRWAAISLAESNPAKATIRPKVSRRDQQAGKPRNSRTLTCPITFDHFVMNLPATAIEFLDAFVGAYAGKEGLFAPHTDRLLPMVHVYCFSTHSADEHVEHVDICQRISDRIGFEIKPEDRVGGTGNEKRELDIYNVRLVSPNKQMFCASFRLPEEVAFRKL